MYHYHFITEANYQHFENKVLSWLKNDFFQRGNPSHHFWHNAQMISDYFAAHRAMVVTNDKNELVAYMVWSTDDKVAEVQIIEVVPAHRRKGIFREMIDHFSKNYKPDLLTASVLKQSETAFKKLGWTETPTVHNRKKFYKAVAPTVKPRSTCPKKGLVIALCTRYDFKTTDYVDYYTIQRDPKRYPMKYYPIQVSSELQLKTPIIAEFHQDDYIGVFYNGKFITSDKAKNLVNNFITVFNALLFINQLDPKNEDLMHVLSTAKKFDSLKRPREEDVFEKSPIEKRNVKARYTPKLNKITETPEPVASPPKVEDTFKPQKLSFATSPILERSSPIRSKLRKRPSRFKPQLSTFNEDALPPSPKQ